MIPLPQSWLAPVAGGLAVVAVTFAAYGWAYNKGYKARDLKAREEAVKLEQINQEFARSWLEQFNAASIQVNDLTARLSKSQAAGKAASQKAVEAVRKAVRENPASCVSTDVLRVYQSETTRYNAEARGDSASSSSDYGLVPTSQSASKLGSRTVPRHAD